MTFLKTVLKSSIMSSIGNHSSKITVGQKNGETMAPVVISCCVKTLTRQHLRIRSSGSLITITKNKLPMITSGLAFNAIVILTCIPILIRMGISQEEEYSTLGCSALLLYLFY